MLDGGVAVTTFDGDGTRPGGAREIMPGSMEVPNSFKVTRLYPGGRPQAVSDATAAIITITSQNNLFFTRFISNLIIRLVKSGCHLP